jgi:hypothetical protein
MKYIFSFLLLIISIMVLYSCQKDENPCEEVIQDDLELVE